MQQRATSPRREIWDKISSYSSSEPRPRFRTFPKLVGRSVAVFVVSSFPGSHARFSIGRPPIPFSSWQSCTTIGGQGTGAPESGSADAEQRSRADSGGAPELVESQCDAGGRCSSRRALAWLAIE